MRRQVAQLAGHGLIGWLTSVGKSSLVKMDAIANELAMPNFPMAARMVCPMPARSRAVEASGAEALRSTQQCTRVVHGRRCVGGMGFLVWPMFAEAGVCRWRTSGAEGAADAGDPAHQHAASHGVVPPDALNGPARQQVAGDLQGGTWGVGWGQGMGLLQARRAACSGRPVGAGSPPSKALGILQPRRRPPPLQLLRWQS
jgi:hypothetical protein